LSEEPIGICIIFDKGPTLWELPLASEQAKLEKALLKLGIELIPISSSPCG
jgi:hypothetical protein